MIIIEYYFNDYGGWIDYSQDGLNIRKDFNNGDEIRQFIIDNNLNIPYKGCVIC
jgi:hypothetical protein